MEDKLVELLGKAEDAIVAVAPDVWNALIVGEQIEGVQELMLLIVVAFGVYFHLTRLFSFHIPLIEKQDGYSWKPKAIAYNIVFVVTGILLAVLTPIAVFEIPDTFTSLFFPEIQVTRELVAQIIG